MQLEIVSPERVLLNGEVTSVTVPGVKGMFQMLDHHAPILSVLEEGFVRFQAVKDIPEAYRKNFIKGNGTELTLKITGGVVEMKNNKAIILVD